MDIPTLTPRKEEGSHLHVSDPKHKAKIIDSFQGINKEQYKGGKKKSSQGAQTKSQPQPSTSSHISPRNVVTPQVHCSGCGGKDHLRKDCHQDTFCTRCRLRLYTTKMCCAPTKLIKDNNICIHCSSKSHTSDKCTYRLIDNREEPRSTLRDLQDYRFRNTGNSNHFFYQNRGGHQQARFDERFNRQYLPNYSNYQPSPLGSIPGQDLTTTLIDWQIYNPDH